MKTAIVSATVDLSEYRKTGDYEHFINLVTQGFLTLPQVERTAILGAFMRTLKGDHHYTVTTSEGNKVYICENGAGYTAMLPEEY